MNIQAFPKDVAKKWRGNLKRLFLSFIALFFVGAISYAYSYPSPGLATSLLLASSIFFYFSFLAAGLAVRYYDPTRHELPQSDYFAPLLASDLYWKVKSFLTSNGFVKALSNGISNVGLVGFMVFFYILVVLAILVPLLVISGYAR